VESEVERSKDRAMMAATFEANRAALSQLKALCNSRVCWLTRAGQLTGFRTKILCWTSLTSAVMNVPVYCLTLVSQLAWLLHRNL